MNIIVKTELPNKQVTLTLKDSLTSPLVQTTGSNCETTFTGISGTHEITTNDKIVSVITEVIE